MATDDYITVIAQLNGPELDEVPAGNLQFSRLLNDAGSCGFTLPILHKKVKRSLLEPGQREVHIYRAGTLVFGGHLGMADVSLGGDLRFSSDGYFARLKRRLIDNSLNYNNTDQFDIAWNLINYTQSKTNGDLGITRAGTTSGVNRDRKYLPWERTSVADAIIEFADMNNGYDFVIDPYKAWHPYYPSKGTHVTDYVFELGKNVGSLAYQLDTQSMANEISAIGAGDGKATCIAVAADTGQQAIYGLLQETISYTDIKSFAPLMDRAVEELRIRKNQRLQPQLAIQTDVPQWGQYDVGDKVWIKADWGYLDIDQEFRIITMEVQLNNEGREIVTVQFDEATEI